MCMSACYMKPVPTKWEISPKFICKFWTNSHCSEFKLKTLLYVRVAPLLGVQIPVFRMKYWDLDTKSSISYESVLFLWIVDMFNKPYELFVRTDPYDWFLILGILLILWSEIQYHVIIFQHSYHIQHINYFCYTLGCNRLSSHHAHYNSCPHKCYEMHITCIFE